MLIGGAAIIVSAPNGVRAQRQSVQEAIGEPTSTAQIGVGGQVDRFIAREFSEELADLILGAVIHHDHPVHRVRLRHHLFQRVFEQLNPLVGDNHRRRCAVGVQHR